MLHDPALWQWYDRASAWAETVTRDPDTARDIALEVLTSVFAEGGTLILFNADKGPFAVWLKRLVVWRAKDAMRKLRIDIAPCDHLDELPCGGPTPEDILIDKQERAQLSARHPALFSLIEQGRALSGAERQALGRIRKKLKAKL